MCHWSWVSPIYSNRKRPAGIQLGYYLEKNGRDYVVIEKSNVPGSFYVNFPRQRKLISINKIHSDMDDPEFKLRVDWNSLLTDDYSFLFGNYSKEYFPQADDLLKYLNDFVQHFHIKIDYETEVENIWKTTDFQILAKNKDQKVVYVCKRVINAIGFSEPNIPKFKEGQEYVETYIKSSNKTEEYKNQRVLIIGKGNSAFEFAAAITPFASVIHMVSRNVVRFAYHTHYVGDIRAVNDQLVDQYQLKSLDGLGEEDFKEYYILKEGDLLTLVTDKKFKQEDLEKVIVVPKYHRIVACTGFLPSKKLFINSNVFPKFDEKGKFPVLNGMFESVNVTDLYFAGVLMHGKDFRKSAGGFIHGYRYLVKNLFQQMEWKHQNIPFNFKKIPADLLVSFIAHRFSTASSIYQMFGYMGDLIVIPENMGKEIFLKCLGGHETEEICKDHTLLYLEDANVNEIPLAGFVQSSEHKEMIHPKRFLTLTLEYNPSFHGEKVFDENRVVNELDIAHKSNFLHPILREYNMDRSSPVKYCFKPKDCKVLKEHQISEHHMIEDFWGKFDLTDSHLEPLYGYLMKIFN